MSLRATGEGHVSSIVFRTGGVSGDGQVSFDPSSRLVAKMRVDQDQTFDKKMFFQKLIEMGAYTEAAKPALDELPARFHDDELTEVLGRVGGREDLPEGFAEAAEQMRWLAHSNYRIETPEDTGPNEIVIFPTSENESRGIEDVRFTEFKDDDGEVTYYGTYTAYNGFKILPQLLETKDFHSFGIHTLNGKYVQNKGMALFPRKIGGRYMMISRLDGENMFIMNSDNPLFWNRCQKLCGPMYPWEFVQIGNCGPPIETPAGWLLLTHGVGPVRRYCIGACLLDLDDPSQSHRSPRPPAARAAGGRARRLRAQRRVLLRGAGPQRHAGAALRRERLGVDGGDAVADRAAEPVDEALAELSAAGATDGSTLKTFRRSFRS